MGWPWICRYRRWDAHLVGSVGAQRQGQAREAWLIHSPVLLPSEAEHHGRLGILEDIGQPAHVTADAQVQLSPWPQSTGVRVPHSLVQVLAVLLPGSVV